MHSTRGSGRGQRLQVHRQSGEGFLRLRLDRQLHDLGGGVVLSVGVFVRHIVGSARLHDGIDVRREILGHGQRPDNGRGHRPHPHQKRQDASVHQDRRVPHLHRLDCDVFASFGDARRGAVRVCGGRISAVRLLLHRRRRACDGTYERRDAQSQGEVVSALVLCHARLDRFSDPDRAYQRLSEDGPPDVGIFRNRGDRRRSRLCRLSAAVQELQRTLCDSHRKDARQRDVQSRGEKQLCGEDRRLGVGRRADFALSRRRRRHVCRDIADARRVQADRFQKDESHLRRDLGGLFDRGVLCRQNQLFRRVPVDDDRRTRRRSVQRAALSHGRRQPRLSRMEDGAPHGGRVLLVQLHGHQVQQPRSPRSR